MQKHKDTRKRACMPAYNSPLDSGRPQRNPALDTDALQGLEDLDGPTDGVGDLTVTLKQARAGKTQQDSARHWCTLHSSTLHSFFHIRVAVLILSWCHCNRSRSKQRMRCLPHARQSRSTLAALVRSQTGARGAIQGGVCLTRQWWYHLLLECSLHSVSLHVPIIPSLHPDTGPITIQVQPCTIYIFRTIARPRVLAPSSRPPLLPCIFSTRLLTLHCTTAPHAVVQGVPVIPSYPTKICPDVVHRSAAVSWSSDWLLWHSNRAPYACSLSHSATCSLLKV